MGWEGAGIAKDRKSEDLPATIGADVFASRDRVPKEWRSLGAAEVPAAFGVNRQTFQGPVFARRGRGLLFAGVAEGFPADRPRPAAACAS